MSNISNHLKDLNPLSQHQGLKGCNFFQASFSIFSHFPVSSIYPSISTWYLLLAVLNTIGIRVFLFLGWMGIWAVIPPLQSLVPPVYIFSALHGLSPPPPLYFVALRVHWKYFQWSAEISVNIWKSNLDVNE